MMMIMMTDDDDDDDDGWTEKNGRSPLYPLSETSKDLKNRRTMKISEIALKLEIPKSMVHEIVHDTLGYRRVSARWIPKMLTEDYKLQRVEISQRILLRCQQDNGDEDMTHIGVGPSRDSLYVYFLD
ncbi:histone-lysine N-methyltransferase SETMAR [Elysia marginata]|uniref:Histone-lysine N-methyltransferase SETMAR n=1 Tax=Elysia marginata TaxID=1093978 RepID=A0AAV4FI53_9GAST|nr:histone-lysine N-methyltransferase SETMAR [Elysia marginata]